jgi:hypothetical protein
MGTMSWHVQYREAGTDRLVRYPTPEEAIEAACRRIDEGCEVYGLGTGSLTTSISRDEIGCMYAFWARTKTPFGRTKK